MSWLTGQRDCRYQTGETLRGDGAAGNVLGRGREPSDREELQKLNLQVKVV